MESRKHGRASRESEKATESYTVNFQIDGPLINTFDPAHYVQEITGDITHHVYDDKTPDGEDGEIVGRVRAWLVQVDRAHEDGEALFDVFDSIDGNLEEYYGPLIDPKTNDLRAQLEEKYDVVHSDILIIDEIMILEKYRHKKIGLAAMLRTIETFGGGVGLAAIKPFPLQFSSAHRVESDWDRKMGFASFCTSENEAFKKLRRYWGTLPFEQLPGSDICVMSLALRHPSLKSLDLDKV